jgi:hypothetical protein
VPGAAVSVIESALAVVSSANRRLDHGLRSLADRLSEEQEADARLRSMVPPEDWDRWSAVAAKHGMDRTRAAAALGLTVEMWEVLAPYSDSALRMLTRQEWRP